MRNIAENREHDLQRQLALGAFVSTGEEMLARGMATVRAIGVGESTRNGRWLAFDEVARGLSPQFSERL